MRYDLTRREQQICNLLLKGYERNSIADELRVKRSTIDTHVLNIYLKLCVNSQRELMAKRIEDLERKLEGEYV